MLVGYKLKKEGIKKPIVESLHRLEIQKSTGRRVEKIRTIDRRANEYHEEVIDDLTRATVHHCKEPLDQHRGHGSAKKKKG